MNFHEASSRFPDLSEDMVVRSTDGEKLGAVIFCGENAFTVEKGLFFPKDFTFHYEDIQALQNGELIVTQAVENLEPWRDETYHGWSAPATGTGMFAGGAFGATPDLPGQPGTGALAGEALSEQTKR